MKAIRLLGLVLVLGLIGGALWFRGGAPEILLTEAQAAPTDAGVAIFMKIENRGAPDRLIGVSSPLGVAALYSPEAETGPPAPTGPGAMLAADGAHITLTGLSDAAAGRLIPLTLAFEHAGEVAVKARVAGPAPNGGAAEAGLFGLGDICVVGEGEPAPAISLQTAKVENGWRVDIVTDEFTFSQERTGLFHVPGEGHGHLYVGGMKMGRLYQSSAFIGDLPKGRHQIRVTLNTNDHRAYVVDDEPVTAVAEIVVD